jgi:putative ABC transport system permease protein
VHPGDHLLLANHNWRVAGIFESGKLARICTKIDVLQRITGNDGKLSQIYLKLKNPDDAAAFSAQLKKDLNPGDPDHGYQIYTIEEYTSLLTVSSVGMLKDFIGVVIGVAAIVG